jgi:hypothetical protein
LLITALIKTFLQRYIIIDHWDLCLDNLIPMHQINKKITKVCAQQSFMLRLQQREKILIHKTKYRLPVSKKKKPPKQTRESTASFAAKTKQNKKNKKKKKENKSNKNKNKNKNKTTTKTKTKTKID